MPTSQEHKLADAFCALADLDVSDQEAYLEKHFADKEGIRTELKQMLSGYRSATQLFDALQIGIPTGSIAGLFQNIDPLNLVGKTVANYKVESYLGGGGMGVVYRAIHTGLEGPVALKFLPQHLSADDTALERLRREAIAASRPDHQNIASVHDVGQTDDGSLFIVMRYYDGETLKRRLADGPLPIGTAVEFAKGIASGLAEAHRHGIVHRDVKPANVMITERGIPKIVDFGIAQLESLSSVTGPGRAVGTLKYMSPEQTRGHTVDARSDIWALGVVMYEMISGILPFDAARNEIVMGLIRTADPPDLAKLRPETPLHIVKLVNRCLEKDKADRYQSMEELVADLSGSGHPHASPLTWVVIAVIAAGVAFGLANIKDLPIFNPPPALVNVAVLPFESATVDPLVLEGMYREVAGSLTRIADGVPTMEVVSPIDMSRHGVVTVDDARREFGANRAVTTSIAIQAGQYKIAFRLLDSGSRKSLASRSITLDDNRLHELPDQLPSSLFRLFENQLPDSIDPPALLVGGPVTTQVYLDYARARGYLETARDPSDVEAAVSLLKVVLKEDSLYAPAFGVLADAYLSRFNESGDENWIDLAIVSARKAVKLSPGESETHTALARIFHRKGQYEEAEVAARQAIAIDDGYAYAHNSLGRTLSRLGRHIEAEASLSQAVQIKPRNWRYHNSLGIFYHDNARYGEAANSFAEITRLSPRNPWGYNNLGAALQVLGQWDEAMRNFRLATQANPLQTKGIAMAHLNMAGQHYWADEFDSAATANRIALEYDPLSIGGWANLGNIYFALGITDSARTTWQKTLSLIDRALATNPGDKTALATSAALHAQLGEVGRAREALRELELMGELEPSNMIEVAKCWEILGERQKALAFLEAAMERGVTMLWIDASIWLDDVRESPEYHRLVDKHIVGDTT